ncbi:MAG: acyl-CoA thioesterase [Deltaproteobacteria bacterium]|nr:acyl-CoA thioesterase [Deltaproteobacteria bacterium]
MVIKSFVTNRLVKGEDLNHHGTLFAGRSAQWFVESGFIAAANLTSPERVLCLNIHGMIFKKPVNKGNIIRFESKVVYAGTTSLTSHVKVFFSQNDEFLLEGFITFIYVDENGQPTPHDIVIDAVDPEDIALQEKAKALR